MKTATTSDTIDPSMICPETGLPITSRSAWTDRRFGSGYRLTTRVIGDRILLNQPSGYAKLEDIVDSLHMTDAIVREHINTSAGYVHISDYSRMQGITLEARKHYIHHMERREHLLGLIYFGVSPLFRVMIKLAKRLSLVKFNVQIVKDYRAAMVAALQLTGVDPVGTSPDESVHRFGDYEISQHYENGRHILRCDRWRLSVEDYSLTVEVIDRCIYHAISSGNFSERHVGPVDRLRETVRHMIGLEKGFRAIVTGTAGGHTIGRKARGPYMASLKRWHQQYPMSLYVIYNAIWFVRTAAMLAMPFLPFKLNVAPDLADALALVDRHTDPRTPDAAKRQSLPTSVPEDPSHVVYQLLQFIGDIDWERHGTPRPDQVEKTHTFRPVFDAIALIKGELDALLEERRRAEMALRESQQRFDEVLHHARDILFKRDLKNGTYDYVSDAVSDLLGVSPDEVCKMGFDGVQSMVHPEDLPRLLAFNKKLLEHEKAAGTNTDHVIEYRLRDSQGCYRWFSDNLAIVRDGNGQPAFVIGSNRDITDQRAAQQELKDATERFTTVLDSISAHIYVADMQTFEILFMNRAMRDDFGDGHLGDRCFEVFRHATDACPHCSNDKLVDAHGQPTGVYTWEGLNPVQKRWYLNHDRAIHWVDGRLVRLQISMDISRIKALEAERQEIAERLRHTRKLEAVSTLAGGVAHNFNNLLMVILGNLELMRTHASADSGLSRKIDAAEKAAQRAADLSTLMLTYVGQTKISPQNVDLGTTVAEMADVLKTSVAEQATLTVDLSDSPSFIRADAAKVCQVITNLVTNAAEASGDQPLEIQLSVGSQHCDTVLLSRLSSGERLPEGRYVWLRVSDNGQGMDQETIEKVFDPFFTTKFTGRGLGMAAVMGIMRAHRGGVRIESRPDAGTAVCVYFPEHQQPVLKDTPGIQTPAPTTLRHRGTALLVDDEPLVLELGKQMLASLGFDVLTAIDGLEALDVFEANRDRIRLVVLDVNMPRMGGRQTAERLHRLDPSLPILVASGFTEAQARERLADAPVDGYIKKPFRVEQLQEKIDSIFSASPET